MRHILFDFDELRQGGFAAAATSLYTGLMLLAQPLAMHYGYYNVVEAKQAVFLALSVLLVLALAVREAFQKRESCAVKQRIRTADACMLTFVGAATLGAICSDAPGAAVFGADNRYQGMITILLYGALWFALTRYLRFGKTERNAMLLAGALVSAIGVLNHCGLDPLCVWSVLPLSQRGSYISTIGNIDFYGAYLCLLLPGLPPMLCRAKRGGAIVLWAALLLLIECGSLSAGSDGAAIALVAVSLLTPLILTDVRALCRLPLVWLFMLFLLEMFSLTDGFAQGLYLSHTAQFLARPVVAGALTAGCFFAYLLLGRLSAQGVLRCRRIYGAALCGAAGLLLVAFVLFNTFFRNVQLGALDRFVKLTESWGTDRGRIWRMCMETYKAFPWWRKLIGGGPGCVLSADLHARVFSDAFVDTAHNEYLQYLLTTGAVGLMAYLGLLASVIRDALRRKEDALTTLLLPGIIAYVMQAIVGIAQPATTPLFFLLLSVLGGRVRAPLAFSGTPDTMEEKRYARESDGLPPVQNGEVIRENLL